MNEDAILTILRVASWLGKAAMFFFTALVAGGFFWIIGDIIGGVAVGIAMGITLGILSGVLVVALFNALVNWIFPDLKRMQDDRSR